MCTIPKKSVCNITADGALLIYVLIFILINVNAICMFNYNLTSIVAHTFCHWVNLDFQETETAHTSNIFWPCET